jgi:hypothetical protein
MSEDAIVVISGLSIICGTLILVSFGKLIRSYFEARSRRSQPVFSRELEDRLLQIQATVEATAIEVERVAEANRYLTRILSERASAPAIGAGNDRGA